MQDLDAVLRRGAVFHWDDFSKLDDPGAAPKGKFLVIINAFLPDDVLYYLLTTSQVTELLRGPFRDDVVTFEPGSYDFFNRETAVNVGTAGGQATIVESAVFRGMYYDGEVEYVGRLTDSDMARIDQAIAKSLRVLKELKRLITAW